MAACNHWLSGTDPNPACPACRDRIKDAQDDLANAKAIKRFKRRVTDFDIDQTVLDLDTCDWPATTKTASVIHAA